MYPPLPDIFAICQPRRGPRCHPAARWAPTVGASRSSSAPRRSITAPAPATMSLPGSWVTPSASPFSPIYGKTTTTSTSPRSSMCPVVSSPRPARAPQRAARHTASSAPRAGASHLELPASSARTDFASWKPDIWSVARSPLRLLRPGLCPSIKAQTLAPQPFVERRITAAEPPVAEIFKLS